MGQPASILVTGASSGIGAALARGLAARGEPLVLTARRLDRLEALAAELSRRHGVAVQAVACDLARPDAVQALRAELEQRDLAIKGLVNSAGFGLRGPVESTNTAQLEALLRLTVQAMVELTTALLPQLAQHPDAAILNVASLTGLVPGLAGSAVYSASKAFVIRFSQALAAEQSHQGVRVMVVCPGYVRSEFHAVLGVEDQMRDRCRNPWRGNSGAASPAAIGSPPPQPEPQGGPPWPSGRVSGVPGAAPAGAATPARKMASAAW